MTTNQIGQLFQAGIEIEGRIFQIEKSLKTYVEMMDILRSTSCIDCKNLEQSNKDLCLELTQIMNGETATVS